jgi:hypothetical protein
VQVYTLSQIIVKKKKNEPTWIVELLLFVDFQRENLFVQQNKSFNVSIVKIKFKSNKYKMSNGKV